MILNDLGKIYEELGKFDEAYKLFEQILDISFEVGDRWKELNALNELGKVNKKLGKTKKALKYYKQALSTAREIENLSGEGSTMKNIGELYFEQKRYDVALACLLLATKKLEEVQSRDFVEVQRTIEELSEEIGEKQYALLVALVEPQANQKMVEAISTETNGDPEILLNVSVPKCHNIFCCSSINWTSQYSRARSL